MATKTTATSRKLRATAKALKIKITKTLRGKRYYKSDAELRRQIATAKKRKTAATKKRKTTTTASRRRLKGSSDTKRDEMYSAKKAGKRKASKVSVIEYIHTDPKTGKKTKRKFRRKNATSSGGKYIRPKTGNVYFENRRDRADKNKWE
tara:strand:- start:3358 stop:3804 length:447 start_codon:yes stop_codon:yes gene_type:complete